MNAKTHPLTYCTRHTKLMGAKPGELAIGSTLSRAKQLQPLTYPQQNGNLYGFCGRSEIPF